MRACFRLSVCFPTAHHGVAMPSCGRIPHPHLSRSFGAKPYGPMDDSWNCNGVRRSRPRDLSTYRRATKACRASLYCSQPWKTHRSRTHYAQLPVGRARGEDIVVVGDLTSSDTTRSAFALKWGLWSSNVPFMYDLSFSEGGVDTLTFLDLTKFRGLRSYGAQLAMVGWGLDSCCVHKRCQSFGSLTAVGPLGRVWQFGHDRTRATERHDQRLDRRVAYP